MVDASRSLGTVPSVVAICRLPNNAVMTEADVVRAAAVVELVRVDGAVRLRVVGVMDVGGGAVAAPDVHRCGARRQSSRACQARRGQCARRRRHSRRGPRVGRVFSVACVSSAILRVAGAAAAADNVRDPVTASWAGTNGSVLAERLETGETVARATDEPTPRRPPSPSNHDKSGHQQALCHKAGGRHHIRPAFGAHATKRAKKPGRTRPTSTAARKAASTCKNAFPAQARCRAALCRTEPPLRNPLLEGTLTLRPPGERRAPRRRTLPTVPTSPSASCRLLEAQRCTLRRSGATVR